MDDFTALMDLLYKQKVKRTKEDHLRWKHTKSGKFEVRSFHRLISLNNNPNFPWTSVWRNKVPHKVAFFYLAGSW
jgi:hypothetical protein